MRERTSHTVQAEKKQKNKNEIRKNVEQQDFNDDAIERSENKQQKKKKTKTFRGRL